MSEVNSEEWGGASSCFLHPFTFSFFAELTFKYQKIADKYHNTAETVEK